MGRKLKLQKSILAIFEEIKMEINNLKKTMIVSDLNKEDVGHRINLIYGKFKRIYPILNDFYLEGTFAEDGKSYTVEVKQKEKNGINNSPKSD